MPVALLIKGRSHPLWLRQTATCLQEVRAMATVSKVVSRTAVSIRRRAGDCFALGGLYARVLCKANETWQIAANCLASRDANLFRNSFREPFDSAGDTPPSTPAGRDDLSMTRHVVQSWRSRYAQALLAEAKVVDPSGGLPAGEPATNCRRARDSESVQNGSGRTAEGEKPIGTARNRRQ